eukprot:3281036-Pleurochrysis_carterae.AAC.2
MASDAHVESFRRQHAGKFEEKAVEAARLIDSTPQRSSRIRGDDGGDDGASEDERMGERRVTE